VLYGLGSYSGVMASDSLPTAPAIGWATVIACMMIGLADDLKSNLLSPRFRLLSTVVIFSLCLGLWSSLIPRSLGVPVLDTLLAMPFVRVGHNSGVLYWLCQRH